MAIAVAQEVRGQDPTFSTSGTTIAATITVAAGSYLHVIAVANTGSGQTATISDGTNTYTAIGTLFQSGKIFHWTTAAAVSSGTLTLTVTFGSACTLKGIVVREITGSSGYQSVHSENADVSPGTGANHISSGTLTPSTQPALVSALSVTWSFISRPQPGSGFTSSTTAPLLGNVWDWGDGPSSTYACVESLRLTSLSLSAGLFTSANGTDTYGTIAALFTEAAAGAAVAIPDMGWTPRSSTSRPRQDQSAHALRPIAIPTPAGWTPDLTTRVNQQAPLRMPRNSGGIPSLEPWTPDAATIPTRTPSVRADSAMPLGAVQSVAAPIPWAPEPSPVPPRLPPSRADASAVAMPAPAVLAPFTQWVADLPVVRWLRAKFQPASAEALAPLVAVVVAPFESGPLTINAVDVVLTIREANV